MVEESAQSVLQRLLRKAGEAAVGAEITPIRLVRLSMARAAQTSIGLSLTVLGVTEEIMPFDDVLALVTEDRMLLSLDLEARPMGFAALDLQLRTAVVELQTVGSVSDTAAQDRRITDADAALNAPLVTAFLEDLSRTAAETAMDGWADGYSAGARFGSTRAIGMALEDRPMRLVRLQLDLGGNERQAELLIALPAGAKPQQIQSSARKPGGFDEQMRETILSSQTDLTAVLHRLRLPLKAIRGFEVGQVIGLPGVTVASVRLEARDGTKVADAKLGQATGLRALRIQGATSPQLQEVMLGEEAAEASGLGAAPVGEFPMVGGPALGLGGPGGESPGFGNDLPATGGLDGMADMALPPDLAPPEGDVPAMGALPEPDLPDLPDPGADDMPDFAAAPMGEGDFGFPGLDAAKPGD